MLIFRKANDLSDYLEFNREKLTGIFFYFFLFLLLLIRIAIVFSYQGQLAGIDNNFDYPVMRLLKSLSIYPDPENYPFAVNPYAPLFFYISWLVCSLLGIDGGDSIQLFFVTRGLCLVFDLISISLLYRILCKYLSVSRPIAYTGVLCFFYLVSYWGYTMNRSDSLVLLLFSILLFYLLKYANRISYRQVLVLALVCNLAIFTKQNAIIFPFLAGITLAFQKKWKQVLLFLLFFGVLFPAAYLLFTGIYPNFLAHLVKALNNRIDFQWFYVDVFKRIVGSFAVIPLTGGIFLSICWFIKRPAEQVALPLASIVMTGWGTILAFKWGSHVGYYNESFFCIAAIIAVYANRPGMKLFREKVMLPTLFVLFFILAHIALQLYFFYLNDRETDKKLFSEQKEVADYLLNATKATNHYIFAHTDHYNDFFKVLLQEKGVVPNQDAVSCCTLPDGNFNYDKLREGFSNGNIEYIIFGPGKLVTEYQHISLAKYKYYKNMNGYLIYRFSN